MVGTIIAKYASYCGLIFMDKRHTMKSMKIYAAQKFLHISNIHCMIPTYIYILVVLSYGTSSNTVGQLTFKDFVDVCRTSKIFILKIVRSTSPITIIFAHQKFIYKIICL